MNPNDKKQVVPPVSRLKSQGRIRVPFSLATLALMLIAPAAGTGLLPAQDEVTVRGTLKFVADKAVLQSSGTVFQLTSANETLAAVLGDSRLEGRSLQVTGKSPAKAILEVKDFFVVREGKLYRVIYHCDVCNITTFTPGDCMCCRAPTQLVEVPPTDPRLQLENPPSTKSEKSPR
jgi:hypothetical protein